MRGISLAHLRRSGGHAVALWLMGHYDCSALSNANTWGNPHFKITTWMLPDATSTQSDGTVRRGLRSSTGGLDPRVVADAVDGRAIPKQLMIVSYEDPDLTRSFPEQWSAVFPPVNTHHRVLVIRSFYNHIASRIAYMRTRKVFAHPGYKPDRVQWWKQHAREALCPLYKVVAFDSWFHSASYRRMVEERLSLPCNDRHLLTVGSDGSGSSFDKTSFNGQAQRMDVLHRWQSVQFPDEVLQDNEAREMNHALFGWSLDKSGAYIT